MEPDSPRAGEAGGSQSDMTDGEAAEAFAKKVKETVWEVCELENQLNIAKARLQVFRVKQRLDEEERLAAALNVQEAMREERRSSRHSTDEDASASQSAQGKVQGRAKNSATKRRLKAIQWPKTWEKSSGYGEVTRLPMPAWGAGGSSKNGKVSGITRR